MNLIDSALSVIAPGLALKRQISRRKLNQIRAYDSSKSGNRTDGWLAPNSSANDEESKAWILRARSRDLTRNNSWAGKALSVIETNVIGYGIVLNIKNRSKTKEEKINLLWKSWSESINSDHEGRNNFGAIQGLVLRSVVESGECLVRKQIISLEKMKELNLSVPLRLQVLEADFLDSDKTGKSDIEGNYILGGIEFNQQGERQFYWLFPAHPGDGYLLGIGRNYSYSTRVPASEILHIYRQDRPGQNRGIPWNAPCIMPLRDLQMYSDAELLKQRIAACTVAFITDPEIPDLSTPSDLEITEKLEPGAIEILPPGKDVKFANPPQNIGYDSHVRAKLQEIASGYGISYESLTGDYSNVNFSSARMGWIEMGRNIYKWQWNLMIPQLLVGVWKWFSEMAVFAGVDLANSTPEFTTPRRESVDPGKDMLAVVRAVRAGLMSLSEAQRELGYDPEVLAEEIRKDRNTYKDVPLDSLPIVGAPVSSNPGTGL